MNLAGLGYAAGGLAQGLDAGARRRLEDLQAQSLQSAESGKVDAGNAIAAYYGGQPQQQPQGGLGGLMALLRGGGQQPQGGAPQQPGPPMQLQGGMPQQPQGDAPGMPPQGGPQIPPGMSPQTAQAIHQLDLPTLMQVLASQGKSGSEMVNALIAISPVMNATAKQQYLMATVPIRQEMADAGKKRADTYATTEPIKADASAKRAETGAKNEASLEKSRGGRLAVDQAKLDQGAQHLKMLEQAAMAKDKAGAERYFTQLQNVRANAMIASHGDANDPTVKGIDEQIKIASNRLQELNAAPSEHPDGWEGKDKGRPEPLVATPIGGAAGGDEPPVKGARKAADGNWYVEKNGKYFRVEQ